MSPFSSTFGQFSCAFRLFASFLILVNLLLELDYLRHSIKNLPLIRLKKMLNCNTTFTVFNLTNRNKIHGTTVKKSTKGRCWDLVVDILCFQTTTQLIKKEVWAKRFHFHQIGVNINPYCSENYQFSLEKPDHRNDCIFMKIYY